MSTDRDKTTEDRIELDELMAKAEAWFEKATPEEKVQMWRIQRRSYVAAEMAIGDDADEAAYRAAHAAGDEAKMAELRAEGQARSEQAMKYMEENGL